MRQRTMLRGLAALALLTAPLAACGDDDDDDATPAVEDDGGDTGSTEDLEITMADYSYTSAPDELEAGVVTMTLVNEGKVAHEAALIEIGDTSLEDFLLSWNPAMEGGPFPAEAENISGPAEVEPGVTTEATFTVAEGTYALMCNLSGDASAPPPAEGEEAAEGDAHFNRGMAQVLEVTAGAEGALPEADGSITASDYTFAPDVEAGDTTINFVNDGPGEVHFASVSVFPEGTDVAAAEAAFGTLVASDGPPPEGALAPEDVGSSGVFSAGLGGQFDVEGGFQSGRTYLLACFIQDRAGGPPHAIGHQMYKAFTVE